MFRRVSLVPLWYDSWIAKLTIWKYIAKVVPSMCEYVTYIISYCICGDKNVKLRVFVSSNFTSQTLLLYNLLVGVSCISFYRPKNCTFFKTRLSFAQHFIYIDSYILSCTRSWRRGPKCAQFIAFIFIILLLLRLQFNMSPGRVNDSGQRFSQSCEYLTLTPAFDLHMNRHVGAFFTTMLWVIK